MTATKKKELLYALHGVDTTDALATLDAQVRAPTKFRPSLSLSLHLFVYVVVALLARR